MRHGVLIYFKGGAMPTEDQKDFLLHRIDCVFARVISGINNNTSNDNDNDQDNARAVVAAYMGNLLPDARVKVYELFFNLGERGASLKCMVDQSNHGHPPYQQLTKKFEEYARLRFRTSNAEISDYDTYFKKTDTLLYRQHQLLDQFENFRDNLLSDLFQDVIQGVAPIKILRNIVNGYPQPYSLGEYKARLRAFGMLVGFKRADLQQLISERTSDVAGGAWNIGDAIKRRFSNGIQSSLSQKISNENLNPSVEFEYSEITRQFTVEDTIELSLLSPVIDGQGNNGISEEMQKKRMSCMINSWEEGILKNNQEQIIEQYFLLSGNSCTGARKEYLVQLGMINYLNKQFMDSRSLPYLCTDRDFNAVLQEGMNSLGAPQKLPYLASTPLPVLDQMPQVNNHRIRRGGAAGKENGNGATNSHKKEEKGINSRPRVSLVKKEENMVGIVLDGDLIDMNYFQAKQNGSNNDSRAQNNRRDNFFTSHPSCPAPSSN